MRLRRLFFEGEILRLMGFTVLIKPLAMVTQMLTARVFGASAQLDAFNFTLFLVMFAAQTVGAVFATVIIPQLARVRERLDPAAVAAYQNAVIVLFFAPVVGLMVFMFFGGSVLVDLVGPSLPEETRAIANRMVRFMALPALLFCVVKINSSLLNLNKRFRLPAAMLPMHTVLFLLGLVAGYRTLGIWALPAAWVGSYVVQSTIISVRALAIGAFRFVRPSLPAGEMSKLWVISWMVLVSQSVLTVNAFVDKWFATALPVGSISHVTYAHTIINFGVQVFSMSLVVVVFTTMADHLANRDFAACDRYLSGNLVRVTNLVVPFSAGMFVASAEIVRVLFQRGAFTAADADVTGNTLGMYLLGLPAIVINGLVARLFHSLQKMRVRIWLALQYLVTNVVGNILLVKTLGTVGLAISTSVAINLHVLISLVVLKCSQPELSASRYMGIVASSYVMAAAALLLYDMVGAAAFLEGAITITSGWTALFLGMAKVAVIVSFYGVILFGWRTRGSWTPWRR